MSELLTIKAWCVDCGEKFETVEQAQDHGRKTFENRPPGVHEGHCWHVEEISKRRQADE